MDKLYQIYLITDLSNSKKYVGQVVQRRGYKTRFIEHLCGTKTANTRMLSNAIKKHGAENFIIELIESDIPESEIDAKEKFYIEKYKTYYTYKNGYNMTAGGQGTHGYRHSAESRRKISEAGKIHWQKIQGTEELILRNQKISEKLKGQSKSDVARRNYSLAARKRFSENPGTFSGRKHAESTKIKIAEKNGRPVGMYNKVTEELLKTFLSAMEASRYLNENGYTSNISASTRIRTICNKVKGQGKTAYGFIWKYLE